VGKYTYQILNIIPKDRRGVPVADLVALRVDADKSQAGIQELKEWIGVMEYIKSFPDTNGDGLPDVPDKYRGKLGRIVIEPSFNPISLLSRGTMVTWAAFSAVVVFLLILAVIAVLIVKKVGRKRASTHF
jgi:5'-nucleotidase/UDP-sugar diphosphatase